MKKILITLLLATLPSLSYSKDSAFIVTYEGKIVFSYNDIYNISNTSSYMCDIDKIKEASCKNKSKDECDSMAYSMCRVKVEEEAKAACRKKIIDYLALVKKEYMFRTCEVK